MRRLVSSLVLGAVLLSGAQALAKPACSAAGLTLSSQAGLPPAVAKMRQAIAQAASSCGYAQLEKLSKQSSSFNFTFGDPAGGPAKYWKTGEARGEAPLATLVKVLNLPYAKPMEAGSDALYVWPSAYGDQPTTEADWKALRPLYDSDKDWKSAVEHYKNGEGYAGPRVGITRGGKWAFFVAGD